MADYIVSARKYRPKSFEEVVGQSHVTTTLTNAIKNNHLAHAMLFCGPRGIGKTTCARILAKTINGFDDAVFEGSGMALNIFELDGASNNKVEHIRDLIEQVRYPPQVGKYKVYIIDEVHMLSSSAFNAFLKTLEEPPPYAIFVLATTEKHKVIPTILSRCQIYDFNRIDVPEIELHLESIAKKENIKAEKDALHLIAQKSDGSLRDALSLFDQLVAFSGNDQLGYDQVLKNLHILDYDYYLRMTDSLNREDHESAVILFDEILKKGFDGLQLVLGFLEHLRNLLMLQATSTSKLVLVPQSAIKQYEDQSQAIDKSLILSWISILQSCEQHYKISSNQKILVELSLVKMAYVKQVLGIEEPAISDKKKSPSGSAPITEEKSPPVVPVGIPKTEELKTIVVSVSQQTSKFSKSLDKQEESESFAVVKESVHSWTKEEGKSEGNQITVQPKAGSRININEKIEDEEGSQEPDFLKLLQTIKEDQPFDEQALKNAWSSFLEVNKTSFPPALIRILERPPILADGKVQFKIGNPVEENHLKRIKADLNYHLKKSLNNKQVELVILQNSENEEKVPYTSSEKFTVLAKENPSLNELQDRLGLEIEF